jgi:hypothetical protein
MARTLRAFMVAVVFCSGASTACGSPLNPAGTSCSGSGECGAGLSCLPLTTAGDAGCEALLTVCSKSCRTDADCAAVGSGFTCFPTCSGAGTCGRSK